MDRPFIAFDLEGPLSPNDNAYELMGLAPGGERLFEAISRYDDLLTLEGRSGYEPGDSLALILPFLVYYHLGDAHILELAGRANLVPGVVELLGQLQSQWQVYLITTTYLPYAQRLGQRLGLKAENIAATEASLDSFQGTLGASALSLVEAVAKELQSLIPVRDDGKIKERLDGFYWGGGELTHLVQRVKPMGGRRKLAALEGFARAQGNSLAQVVAVGDSITDFCMLEAVDRAGGLAVAFNANEYALPYATIGLASPTIYPLLGALESWAKGQREQVKGFVRSQTPGTTSGYFHWLKGERELPLEIHRHFRRLVRARAAELG